MSQAADRSGIARAAAQPLVSVLAVVSAGIVADRYAPLSVIFWWPLALTAWVGWWVAWRRGCDRAAVGPLLLALLAAGATWHHCSWSLFDGDDVGQLAPEVAAPAAVEGRVVGRPRRMPAPPYDPLRVVAGGDRTRLDLDVTAVRDLANWRASSGRTTLFVNGYLGDLRSGDRVRVFGQLQAARPADNPGGFDFARQARGQRHLCWMSTDFPECVTTIHRAGASSWARVIDALGGGGDALLWRNLSPGRSGLAAAMFLGAREGLQPDETQAFLETGTIHLLVISGLNVGILAFCLLWALERLLVPQRVALTVVALATVLYAVTTDSQPPVVRATAMVLVGCAATTLGRRAIAYNTIAAAGLVVLALNPQELFQAGTQLSFLCVVVLAWLAEERSRRALPDPLARLIAATRPWPQRSLSRAARLTGRTVLASAAIWVVICPLVMARFHLVSPVAVVLGPVLAIPVAMAMAAGFGIFAFGWLVPPLAAALGGICNLNLSIIERAVDAARTWPGNHFWVPGPANWWLVGFYGAMLVWTVAPRLAPPRRWCVALVAGWIALGLSISLFSGRARDRLDCEFLAVGHGAAIVVELPSGQTLLYDAGRLGSPTTAARAVAGYLWTRGKTGIDMVVISHADADHYNALPALVDQFAVGTVYVSPVMFERSTPALDALRRAIDRRGVPLRQISGGDRLRTSSDTVHIEVLHPPRRGVLGSDNANSIVLTIEYQGRRLLLTGDLESPGLDDVVAEEPLDCDVVLAPHHGSASSDPPGFARWCTPEWTVVSSGPRARLEASTTAYGARGGRVLHTASCGAVHVSIHGGRLAVDCWHSGAAQ